MAGGASPVLRREPPGTHTWVLVAAGLLAIAVASGISVAVGELQALYLSLAVALCVSVFADFRIGAVALIVLLPLQNLAFFPHELMGIRGLNPANVVLGATLASWLVSGRAPGAGPIVRAPLVWLYLVPIAVAGAIGAFHADEVVPIFWERELVHFTDWPGYVRDIVVRPLLLVVVALLVGSAAARSQKPERFLVPIALSVMIMAAVVIGYVVQSGVPFGMLASARMRDFLTPLGIHANAVGRLFAAAYALLLFAWWQSRRPGLRLFLFIAMGVLAFALLLTFSRGAFTGFLLVNLIFLAWKFSLRTLGLGLAALVLLVALAPGYVYDRVTVGFDSGSLNAITAGRIEGIWEPLAPELLRSPLWGNGLGATMWVLPQQIGAMLPVTHPHNAYLEALLDMGVVGLALLLAYFWHVFRGFRALGSNPWLAPEMRGLFQGGVAALGCFLVTGLAGSSLRPDPDFTFLWIAIGLMYGMMARRPAD